MDDWREDRVASALRGENPMVMARLPSGFAVIGDTQHLPGYSLLICDDRSANHLTDLETPRRTRFLMDMALLGEAVSLVCADNGLRRMNYEILGNSEEWLHAHVHPRYDWEPADRRGWPVWCYPPDEREAPEHAYDENHHGELRQAITFEIERLIRDEQTRY